MGNALYSVDFANGNLMPSPDAIGSGAMEIVPDPLSADFCHPADGALKLSITRRASPSDGQVSIGVWAQWPGSMPPPWMNYPKCLLHLDFDSIEAGIYTHHRPPSPMPKGSLSGAPVQVRVGRKRLLKQGPWAVGLMIKTSVASEEDQEKSQLAATCQFQTAGVRLNVPLANGGKGTKLDVLESYPDLGPFYYPSAVRFSLDLEIESIDSSNLVTGTAKLFIRRPTGGLTPPHVQQPNMPFTFQLPAQAQIERMGAGVAISEKAGVGTATVRLLHFSLSTP